VPGSYALMPAIAPAHRLQRANAALTGALQAGNLAGPLIGAALVARAGPAAAFALDAATFAISALTLASLRPVAVPPQEQHTAPKLRVVLAATPALPVMLIVVLAGNLASGGVFAVALPVLAHQRFGTSGYGLVLAALAAGAVAGTTLGAWIRSRRPAVTADRLFLAQTAALVLFPIAGLAGAAVAAVTFGLANATGELIIVTALQRSFPPAFLGRMMGLVFLTSAGAFPSRWLSQPPWCTPGSRSCSTWRRRRLSSWPDGATWLLRGPGHPELANPGARARRYALRLLAPSRRSRHSRVEAAVAVRHDR
jgi:predicted MFS family arabinose efflux permease